jgi:hypothetical protein
MEWPVGVWMKIPQVTHFDFVLIYAIYAGAGDQAYILAKRCSVMPYNVFV